MGLSLLKELRGGYIEDLLRVPDGFLDYRYLGAEQAVSPNIYETVIITEAFLMSPELCCKRTSWLG